MSEHPIQGLMRTAMENLREMVDANTIVGDPVETPDGTVVLPISKVGFGFAAGGSEFLQQAKTDDNRRDTGTTARFESPGSASVALPFGGGSGGGVSITPIAFLVVGPHGVKVVPLDHPSRLFERLIDSAPGIVDKIQGLFTGNAQDKADAQFDDVTLASPMEGIPTGTPSPTAANPT
ncbi:GerW family sporulation protein [Paenibacillus alkalitolerans]|uniref:GerW family sporulation protein n=1 Tax=Paenibacillus alkalitolerans TaxID=2799335 RepID=UPI0018F320CE|nr:GerW family sporulation protein [Paenibacillus alkalitolerans]